MFDFLKTITIKETVAVKEVRKTTKNPEGFCLRVYSNGKVYPSEALVKEFNLEYGENSNGLDFVEAHKWGAYPKDRPNLIFVTPVNRTEPKIDLFGTKRSEETSVLTQGVANMDLWEAAVRIYGTPAEDNFIDIMVDVDTPIKTEDGIFYLPKTVARGDKKGTTTVVRRENIVLYPAFPKVMVTATEDEITIN